MTAEEENSNKTSAPLHPLDMARGEAAAASTQTSTGYEVGYGRPPVHAQFKPGQSGNPKGRPKRKLNMLGRRREIYVQPVKLPNGRKVPAILAADMALLGKALKGDPRAVQAVFKVANDIGVFDENELTGYPLNLTKEEIRALSDEDLAQIRAIFDKVEKSRLPN
jgi:hypothetical protein